MLFRILLHFSPKMPKKQKVYERTCMQWMSHGVFGVSGKVVRGKKLNPFLKRHEDINLQAEMGDSFCEGEWMKQIVWWGLRALPFMPFLLWSFWRVPALPPTPLADNAVQAYRKISSFPQHPSKCPPCCYAALVDLTAEAINKKQTREQSVYAVF